MCQFCDNLKLNYKCIQNTLKLPTEIICIILQYSIIPLPTQLVSPYSDYDIVLNEKKRYIISLVTFSYLKGYVYGIIIPPQSQVTFEINCRPIQKMSNNTNHNQLVPLLGNGIDSCRFSNLGISTKDKIQFVALSTNRQYHSQKRNHINLFQIKTKCDVIYFDKDGHEYSNGCDLILEWDDYRFNIVKRKKSNKPFDDDARALYWSIYDDLKKRLSLG